MNDITVLSPEKLAEIRQRYSPKPIPKCRICGAEMSIGAVSASRTVYACSGATHDENGWHYAPGRSLADDHYSESRVTVVDVSDPDVLALVEALENAQRQIQAHERAEFTWLNALELPDDASRIDILPAIHAGKYVLRDATKRIAELESRTVTVKQGEVLVTVSGFTGCGKSAIAGEIEIAMKAIGVPVKWVNGDAEKRMTGADWLTAIEMYKPTVRIVEVNVPRAAGIQVIEGEG